MPSTFSAATPSTVRHAIWATMALFFANGATFATWGIHIPTIRERFGWEIQPPRFVYETLGQLAREENLSAS